MRAIFVSLTLLVAIGGCRDDFREDVQRGEVAHSPRGTSVLVATDVPLRDTPAVGEGDALPVPSVPTLPAVTPEAPVLPPEAPVYTTPFVSTPVYAPGSVEAIICAYPWPCEQALSIARCESGFGRDLYNETPIYNAGVENHAVGWFGMAWPLHAWRWQGGEWGNVGLDAAAAYSLWAEDGGWYAWGCQP